MSGNLRKTIFIGIGGSGGTTLRYLHQELANGLLERGWYEPIPECWQFLLIDVAESPDGVRGDVPKVLTSTSEFYGLSDPRAEWSDFVASLPADPIDVAAGWRPVAPYPAQPKNGASQYRALGRLASLVNLKQITERIETSINHLAGTDADLQKVAKALNVGTSLGVGTENVYLVTSLGGGSGSGLFLDLANVLQKMGKKYTTMLFAPDVFDELGPVGGNRGVTPNTMSAISELLSSWENIGEFSQAENHVMQSAGLGQGTRGRRVADTHIIVGREASGYSLTTQNQVYHTAARALAALTLNGEVNEQVQRYIFDNLDALPAHEGFRSLRINTGNATNDVATSIGFASVSTGRHAFGAYAAERVTRLIIEQLIDDDERVKDAMEDEDSFKRDARNFARRAQLFALNRSENQILDAVRGGSKETLVDFARSVREKALAHLNGAPFGQMGVRAVEAAINQDFESVQATEIEIFSKARAKRVNDWTASAQAKLLNEIVQSIAEHGLGMTIEFLRQTQTDLKEGSKDLRSEAGSVTAEVRKIRDSLKGIFAQQEEKLKLALSSTPVKNALDAQQGQLLGRVESGTSLKAADLIDEFCDDVITPLLSVLSSLRADFRSSATREEVKAVWNQFASGETPARLIPTENEIFLDNPLTFQSDLEEVLDKMFGQGSVKGLQMAAAEVLKSVWEGKVAVQHETSLTEKFPEFAKQSLIQIDTLWTSDLEGLSDGGTSARGKYSINPVSIDVLMTIARSWQRERVGISTYTSISLKDYVYPENGPERTDLFLDGLERALAMSGCLAEPDRGGLQAFAGPQVTPTTVLLIGGIPVRKILNGVNTAEAEAVISLLMKYAKDQFQSRQVAEQKIDVDSGVSSVEIVSVFKEKLHPAIFRSISEPIRQGWAEVISNRNKRENFYTMRRSRVLPEFIPVSRPVLINMIQGWIIATTLGHVTSADLENFLSEDGHHAIGIYDPKASKASGYQSQFPDAVLRGGRQGQDFARPDILGSLLESMILAFASMEHGWLDSYVRLARLGNGQDKDLEQWLQSGNVTLLPGANLDPVIDSRLNDADSFEMRKEKMSQVLDAMLSDVKGLEAESYDLEDILNASRKWELRHEYRSAIQALKDEVQALGQTSERGNEV